MEGRRRRDVPLEATLLLHEISKAHENQQMGATTLKCGELETVL